jgi:hypothetical protein
VGRYTDPVSSLVKICTLCPYPSLPLPPLRIYNLSGVYPYIPGERSEWRGRVHVNGPVPAAGGLGGHNAEAGRLEPGLEKTRFKKNQPSGFFCFFFRVSGFFLYICPEERVFRVYSVSSIQE